MNPTPSPERPEPPEIIGYIKRNNGIKGPGFAEWDEPVYRSPIPKRPTDAQLERLIVAVREERATRTAPEAVAGERKDYPKYCATCRNYLSGFCQLRGVESPNGSTSAHWPKCSRLDWCGKHEVEIEMHYFLNNRRMDYNASKEPLTVSQARAALPLELCQREIFWEHDLSEPLGELILIPKNASVVALPEAYPS